MYLTLTSKVVIFVLFLGCSDALLSNSLPIWHPTNRSAHFVYFRSPEFSLPTYKHFVLHITARQTPHKISGNGNNQGKLVCSYKLFVNGIMVTAGPGHNIAQTKLQPQRDTNTQSVTTIDLTSVLHPPPSMNVIAVSSFFNWTNFVSEVPRVQAELCPSMDGVTCIEDVAPLVATGISWISWNADVYHNPSGDANRTPWYSMPNEDLDQNMYPTRWTEVGFHPRDQEWTHAVVQPFFLGTLYTDDGPPIAMLWRKACSVKEVGSMYVIDYGQEFSGGVNLTFPNTQKTKGQKITVVVGEAVHEDGTIVSPTQSGQLYESIWTLAGLDGPNNSGIIQHEMIQFRYAMVINSPSTITTDTAWAWVIQHPIGGTGINPYEIPCAHSTPNAVVLPVYESGTTLWKCSSEQLDRVFNFTAYTVVATSLDVNVDSRTRQRDLCQVDALITMLGQYSVFPPNDTSIQKRTARFSFSNDSSPLETWTEFRMSAALMVARDLLETGLLELAKDTWSDNDMSIVADNGVLNSLQFYVGLRYFNLSGHNLLSFPPSCGGPWMCSVLADWPTSTRDGYVVDPKNTDDTIRNSLGSLAINMLGRIAEWLGKPKSASKYSLISANILKSIQQNMLHVNASSNEAYFVDGAMAPGTHNSAIHSTLYAAAVGVSDGNPKLASQLSSYIIRRDLGPSSCMTGMWVLEACYRLAVFDPDGKAADYALHLLTRTSYPSWGYMIAIGATITLEAWRPQDKGNMDWAHPWCGAPAYAIPRLLMGVQPLEPGWTRFQIVPQPSLLKSISARIPTPAGMLVVSYSLLDAGVMVIAQLLPGMTAHVCLVLPSFLALSGNTNLLVDGVIVKSSLWGRMTCTIEDLHSGNRNITLVAS